MGWQTPKTDWKWTDEEHGDYFNKDDYNRIIGNIEVIRELTKEVNKPFETAGMAEKQSYSDYVYADEFNTIEENLAVLARNTFPNTEFEAEMYFANGPTPDYNELNRIESLLLKRYEFLQGQIHGRKTLAFVLGGSEF